jgi:hypothetical protein
MAFGQQLDKFSQLSGHPVGFAAAPHSETLTCVCIEVGDAFLKVGEDQDREWKSAAPSI